MTGLPSIPLILGLAAGILAALYAGVLISRINKLPAGNEKMQSIAAAIQEGAMAYLGRQYRTVAIVGVVVAIVLLVPGFLGVSGFGVWTAIGFVGRRRGLGGCRLHRHAHFGCGERAHG